MDTRTHLKAGDNIPALEEDANDKSAAAHIYNHHGYSLPTGSPMCTLHYIQGDLFQSTETLAHCVSEDLKMSKGIASTFRSKFGNIDKLQQQHAQVGQIATLYQEEEDRHLIYLVTKKYYFHKPHYSDILRSLLALRAYLQQHNINNLSIPLLACGIDRCRWGIVGNLIRLVFHNTTTVISIFYL